MREAALSDGPSPRNGLARAAPIARTYGPLQPQHGVPTACPRPAGLPRRAKAAHAAPLTGQVGLFFHVYPHNSVQSFHLHIVDLDVTGPTYEVMKYKNMPAEDVLAVLRAEAAGQL